MRFSEDREKQLQGELLKIFTECMLKYKETKDEKLIEEWYFMGEVFKANLVETSKQWFLLGQMAQKIHDVGPKAMKATLDIFHNRSKLKN